MSSPDRDLIAQITAEYIINVIEPHHAELGREVHLIYADDERPPETVEGVKAALLAGVTWLHWMDKRVAAAMREMGFVPGGAE